MESTWYKWRDNKEAKDDFSALEMLKRVCTNGILLREAASHMLLQVYFEVHGFVQGNDAIIGFPLKSR